MKLIDISTKKYPNMFTMVDDQDYELLTQWKWYAFKSYKYFYAVRKYRSNNIVYTILLHRELYIITDTNIYVDHIDHNTLNNQRYNLRICTNSQNQMNSKKHTKFGLSSSIYKGVSWQKDRKKWRSQIKINNKVVNLGSFISEIEAAKVYDYKAKEQFGEFALLNFK